MKLETDKKKYFVISDIHGEIRQFKKMLTYWNPSEEVLIINGDMIDRGENPREVVQLIMELKKSNDIVTLMGNHEDMFLEWLHSPNKTYLFDNLYGTLKSFLGSKVTNTFNLEFMSAKLKEDFSEEMEFLKDLPDCFEADNHLFVHAGVDLTLDSWQDTPSTDMKWIRNEFIYGENKTGKTIIFGHTPTRIINLDESNDIWVSPCKTKIGIDGGASARGLLHGLKVSGNSYVSYSVDQELNCTVNNSVLS